MVINNKHNFIFIHIPKNAGTSLTKFLSQFNTWCDLEIGGTADGEILQKVYRKRFNLRKHSTAFEIMNVIGKDFYQKFFKFAFVRNPFTRTYSVYNFLKKWKKCPKEWKEIINKFESFEEFILSGILFNMEGPDRIFLPQTFWLEYKNSIIIDYIGKVENIEKDLKQILSNLHLEPQKIEIPHSNVSKSLDKNAFNNSKVIDFIRKKYYIDFENFGYEKDIEKLF